ncbi:uncharacterized protein LOC114841799 isoform X2 [Betta splendens]|uniref:Uncharacterized protein LOC114841799 isoform X2 n=1 Tax=Betta splendens TaxID=158456 RepID=A0A6P7KJQ3_BETSP|nr:uncharacterized protein LOC114841799 isoform X2 [Betta splendens]
MRWCCTFQCALKCFFFFAGMGHFTPQVTAQVGQNVTLQCCFDASLNLRTRTVDWKKDDKQVVHVYRDRKDCPDLQETQFRHRTALRHEDLSRGVMTLQILAQLSDTGNFSCNVPKGRGSEMLSQRVMLFVMNTRKVLPNITRFPKKDEMTTKGRTPVSLPLPGFVLASSELAFLGLVLESWLNGERSVQDLFGRKLRDSSVGGCKHLSNGDSDEPISSRWRPTPLIM